MTFHFSARLALCSVIFFGVIQPVLAALPKHNPVPGGVAVVALNIQTEQKPIARFGNQAILVVKENTQWIALVGLSCDTLPGNYIVSAQNPQLEPVMLDLAVLPLPPPSASGNNQTNSTRNQVYKVPEQIDNLDLINRSIAERQLAPPILGDSTSIDFIFASMVESSYIVPYGKIIHRGRLETHNYVSFLGKPELPVYTPMAATVLNVSSSESNGFTVQLDHGNGVVSMLGHLKNILVDTGQKLDQGELLGITRRMDDIKGGKLDWGLSMNGSLINPLQFSSAP